MGLGVSEFGIRVLGMRGALILSVQGCELAFCGIGVCGLGIHG